MKTMRMYVLKAGLGISVALCLVMLFNVSPASAQDQVFTSLQPCVAFDTRPSQGGTGALAANEARTFHIVGSTSNFAGQGGVGGGCGVPGFTGGIARVKAVLINLVAISPAGGGNLKAWATDQTETGGGVVNYQALSPAMNNANAVVVQVRQDSEGADITVRAVSASTNVRGVILGFFREVCDASTGVFYQNKCYYLDGSAGTCDPGYTLAPQSVLSTIATFFVGKNYRNQKSNNCCIDHLNEPTQGEDWGMSTDCNADGPFVQGPTLGGAACTDAHQHNTQQLTLCVSQ